ncbi:signal peptidase II [Chloroflexota bacterium]
MRKVGELRGGWWNVVFFLITLLVIAADQLSKTWIRSSLLVGQSQFEVGFFRLTRIHNTGAAFGLFQGQSFPLTIVASVGIVALLVYVLVVSRGFPFLGNIPNKVALGLVLGGTVGNLIDRLRFGYVTDFIDFGVWPAFNLADSAITVGVIIFAYSLLRSIRAEKHRDGENI